VTASPKEINKMYTVNHGPWSITKHKLKVLQVRINLISRQNSNTDRIKVKDWIQTGLEHPLS